MIIIVIIIIIIIIIIIVIIIIITIIIKKTVPTSLPKEKYLYNTSNGGHMGNSQGIGTVNSCRKISTLEVARILDLPHGYVSAT